jgi:hypothetical protein
MSSTRVVNKNDLEILSSLVFDSYISKELEFQGYYFVIRTLTPEEREDISRKHKHLSEKHNIYLVLEILSNSIMFINGYEFKKDQHAFLLNRLNSRLILLLYKFYQKLDEETIESSKFIDYYIETRESRNLWTIFKRCSRITEPFSIRKINQYRYYWIVMNSFKDSFEEEKKAWSKVEYMTNSICAFTNPKAFRKSRGQMGIVDQLERNEDKSKQLIVEQLEGGTSEVRDNDIFSTLERLPGEERDEHEARLNIMMEKTLKGELVDDYDRIVRQDEIKLFKKYLRDERKKILVNREILKQKGEEFDNSEVLTNSTSRSKKIEEDKKKGFFYEDYSYLEIVNMKDFKAIPKKEKEVAFDEVMLEPIDIKKEVENFLKCLSKPSSVNENVQEPVTMVDKKDETTQLESDSSGILRTPAERASKMNVDVKGVDLMKQRQNKVDRINSTMNQRRQTIEPEEGLDVIKFGDIK